jgi:transcription termination/antitermination protein NusG
MLQCFEWYALQVRQRTEKLTAQLLDQKGYGPFLPTYVVKRRWSDRVRIVDQPLFPGYLFCKLDPRVRMPLLTTPGVISIVGAGHHPIAIPDGEIDAVRRITNSAAAVEPWPYLKSGEKVTISDGPLRGVQGILASVKSCCKVIVSINLLQRSVAVEVDRQAVLPSNVARHLPGRVVFASSPGTELGA